MKALWLHRAPVRAAAPLIVFCNGWGMDERAVAHLDGAGCNVLCLYDYRSPTLPDGLREELAALLRKSENTACKAAKTTSGKGTEEQADADRPEEHRAAAQTQAPCILIAWSLGVFMSTFVRRQLPFLTFDVTLACNGTPRPVDAAYGIPPAVYEATEQTLSPVVRDAFMANAGMDGGLCRQCVDDLREELTAVRLLAHAESQKDAPKDAPPNAPKNAQNATRKEPVEEQEALPCAFDAALISRKDRIFSARNQKRWWQSCPRTRIIMQEGGHYPFAGLRSWLELAHVY